MVLNMSHISTYTLKLVIVSFGDQDPLFSCVVETVKCLFTFIHIVHYSQL